MLASNIQISFIDNKATRPNKDQFFCSCKVGQFILTSIYIMTFYIPAVIKIAISAVRAEGEKYL